MPAYTLLLFVPEDEWVGKAIQRDELEARHLAFVGEVAAAGGKIINGFELTGTEVATTIRKRTDADDVITDGPFAETKEQLGGFYVIEAADLDQVLRLARLLPEPVIEIRPVVQGGRPVPTSAFLLYGSEAGSEAGWEATPEQWEEGIAKHAAYEKEVAAAGAKTVGGEAPELTKSAVMVNAGDEPLVTDGPFAETKEQRGGLYLIEAKDLQQAAALAKRMPDTATVEIRPVVETS